MTLSIESFAEQLAALPPDLLESELLARTELRLWSDERVAVYFTPFGQPTPSARILLVGLTPGLQQHYIATMAAAGVFRAGGSTSEAERAASVAGFAGPLRLNLVEMLDGIGVPEWLGIASTAELWEDATDLMAATSALRHAVFRFTGGRPDNYRGAPNLWRVPYLVTMVDELLACDLAAAPDALIVPLGKVSTECVEHLARAGVVDSERILVGMPHPSGGNGHRVRQYAERREELEAVVARSGLHPERDLPEGDDAAVRR